jgi:drug/metabolite transporter (DMT)-like permease
VKSTLFATCAALLSSVSAVFLYIAFHRHEGASLFWACVIRFGINGLMAVFLSIMARDLFSKNKNPRTKYFLNLWGVLGASTIISYFFAVKYLGAGRASVWLISQALIYPVLESLIFRTRINFRVVLSILGSALGIFFLKQGDSHLEWGIGDFWGAVTCVSAALAYLCMARTPEKVPLSRFMGYWALWCSFALPLLLAGNTTQIPHGNLIWVLLLVSAIFASLAQWLTSAAYQEGSSLLVNSLSFLTPVFSLAIDMTFLGISLRPKELLGAFFLILFGVLIPVSQSGNPSIQIRVARKKSHNAA